MAYSYSIETFTTDFITYLQGATGLNTKLSAINTQNGDTLLTQLDSADYFYITEKDFEKRAQVGFFYETPTVENIESVGGSNHVVTWQWNISLRYVEGGRDARINNMKKVLRYQIALQQCLQEYFKRNGFGAPEIKEITLKNEKDNRDLYRIVNFAVLVTIGS